MKDMQIIMFVCRRSVFMSLSVVFLPSCFVWTCKFMWNIKFVTNVLNLSNQQPCYNKLFVFSCLMCLSQSKWLINTKCPTIQLTENQVLLTCLSATPTPAIAWLCGPPWSDGNTAKSMFLSKSYLISGWRSGMKSHCTKDLSYCVTMYPDTNLLNFQWLP